MCRLSYKGDLEKVKQLFQCVTHQNISEEEMGVQNSRLDEEQRPKLVDAICDLDRPLMEPNTIGFGINSNDFFPEDDDKFLFHLYLLYDSSFIYSPLTSAARGGHAHVCEYLIKEQNANIGTMPSAPLIIAAMYNQTEVIKLLLQHKANTRGYDVYGGHATYYAARGGHLDALKMLLDEDENSIHLVGVDGEPPLLAAAYGGYVEVCKYIVKVKNAIPLLLHPALENKLNPDIIRILKQFEKT